MAYLDDRIWCHPKMAEVPKPSRWIYAAALAYSSGFMTGGILTEAQQKTIGGDAKDRRALLDAGLWDTREDIGKNAIQIHDWDEHNGKRDARKRRDRARKKAGYWAEKGVETPAEDARRKRGESAENEVRPRVVTVVKEVTGEGSSSTGPSKGCSLPAASRVNGERTAPEFHTIETLVDKSLAQARGTR